MSPSWRQGLSPASHLGWRVGTCRFQDLKKTGGISHTHLSPSHSITPQPQSVQDADSTHSALGKDKSPTSWRVRRSSSHPFSVEGGEPTPAPQPPERTCFSPWEAVSSTVLQKPAAAGPTSHTESESRFQITTPCSEE